MLMVTGANGHLGGHVVANLRTLVGPSGFVAGTRDPSFARELAASGITEQALMASGMDTADAPSLLPKIP